MSNTLTGNIKVIKETQTLGSGFQKREFVVTTNDMYPQDVLFEVIKDNCPMLDSYNVGQDINVHFNVRGREWTSPQGEVRYFNTLSAWKIEAAEGFVKKEEEKSDLPF